MDNKIYISTDSKPMTEEIKCILNKIYKEERMNKSIIKTEIIKMADKYGLIVEFAIEPVYDTMRIIFKSKDYQRREEIFIDFSKVEHPGKALERIERTLVKSFNIDLKKFDPVKVPAIKDVIFNDPATIVFWEDGTKTVVKAQDEEFDPEKGLAMAISKKALGNQGNYCNEFKKWIPEEKEKYKIIGEISVPGSLTSNKLIDAVTAAAESISLKVKKGVEI